MHSMDRNLLAVNTHDSHSVPFTDPLTGLGNRHRLKERITRLIADRASDPAPFTLCILNLDGFRPINDLFGHMAGDEILCQVAYRLKAGLPEGTIVTRHDNDEFAFILPLVFERRSAERVGVLFRDMLSAPYDVGDRTVRLSASFGFSIYPYAGATFEDLEKNAETALYRSKRRGTGKITVYSSEIADEMHRATKMEQALRLAITNDAVDVHFQPIVNLENDRVIGFEALARWRDPALGFVSPGDFIPLAEERGFIDKLTELLLRKAAIAALTWPSELFLSFNLSSAQLVDVSTSLNVFAIINQVGLDPKRLVLEITETAVMLDPDTAQKIITDLRSVGIQIALDDFGTGQSSLGRLTEFQFDKVKIDMSFVARLSTDSRMEHIIRAVVSMCKGLKLEVVAEGIEDFADALKLKQLGCGLGQGYFYGCPVDAAATQLYIEHKYRPAGVQQS
jgi:diguanylate cyclase (GGDEF)-like protein